jgi:uncharacterized protein YbjT (DUF2867 family)
MEERQMIIGILGGTGMAGREAARELASRGHEVRILARNPPAGPGHRRVDVQRHDGLREAFAGLDAVLDVLNGPPSGQARAVLVDGLRRALAAAADEGVRHVVSLSIVGVDRVPMDYYRVKVEQEAVVRGSGIPFTIVRATQFHPFVADLLGRAARLPVLPVPRVPVQPVDVRDVAVRLADALEAGPTNAVHDFTGPRVERLDELAREWERAKGMHRPRIPVPAVGGMLRAVRDGGLVAPDAPHGRTTFAAWLAREAA